MSSGVASIVLPAGKIGGARPPPDPSSAGTSTAIRIRCAMDLQLTGTLIVAVAAIPYLTEILLQLPLLARVMAALPPDARAKLPPHPRRPWLAVFGGARFFLALFRYALRRDPDDPSDVARLKGKMRASALREALFGLAFATVIAVLWRHGWRPAWPRFA
jgi:hypothetical protein